MPRTVAIYNGNNNALEDSEVSVEKIDGVTALGRGRGEVARRKLTSMTAPEDSDNRLAMAVEFDHMYIGCSDSKASVGKDLEVQHLKDLLLLHLDLIQQQAEQLVAKDKQIKLLRDENENLKAKLERIDRRVSLSLHKRPVVGAATTNEPHQNTTIEDGDDLDLNLVKSEKDSEDALSPLEKSSDGGKVTSVAGSKATQPTQPLEKSFNGGKVGSVTGSKAAQQGKAMSPAGKLSSPSPPYRAGTPSVKPVSPRQLSPSNKPGSPVNKAVSPGSKPGSPLGIPVSPSTKPISPSIKPGLPATKQSSPTSKPSSPSNKTVTINTKVLLQGKQLSPPSKQASPPGRPACQQSSPPGRPAVQQTSPPGRPAVQQTSPPGRPAVQQTSPPGRPAVQQTSPPGRPAVQQTSPPGRPAVQQASPPGRPSVQQTSPPGRPAVQQASPPGRPACQQTSPPGRPACQQASPPGRPAFPPSKQGSPPGRPASLPSKQSSTHSKQVSPPGKQASPTSKPGSPPGEPANKALLPGTVPKDGSPNTRTTSSITKAVSPISKVGTTNVSAEFLDSKPSSPSGRSVSSSTKSALPPEKSGSSSGKVETPNNKVDLQSGKTGMPLSRGVRSDPVKKVVPNVAVPKTSPRERRVRRDTSQSLASENESDLELAELPKKDVLKSIERRERFLHKRKADTESEHAVKRIRSEKSESPGDTTDHNLRSRDKPKDPAKQESPTVGSTERPATPTARAAALEAKKLRQKLLLKGEPAVGRGVRGEGILNTCVSYYLPYGGIVQEPNPEEECLQAQVEIPRWGSRVLTSLYVMEGTENLEDEIFLKRHSKPEQDEKRRKRWDLQRMREQRHYERLRERYEGRQSTSEPEVSVQGSLWPNPESALYLHVDDCLPVCAFGQPMARIPPEEFTLPWLSGRSTDGVSTRRRKR